MASDNPWQKLIGEPEFRNAIDNRGYYESNLSFQPFVKKYELTLKSRAPSYLSIDFWSGQSKVLIKNKLYVLRTGKGHFVIFSEERFPKPYLELRRDDSVTDIDFELPENYEHLRKAFRNHYQEATNLEYLRFIGVYDKLIEELFEKSNRHYFIGPRGNRNSNFRLYLIDKMKPDEPVLFEYSGQEDLDYTIWTEDSVLA